jgi:transposase
MDAGVATRKNLKLLREHGFGYLVNDSRGQRKRYQAQFREQEAFHVVEGREGKERVLVRVMDDPHVTELTGTGERIVLCRSLPRGEKEQAIMSNTEHRFLDALEQLALRVQKGRLKDRAKIQRAIGRIQSKHTRVGRYYEIELTDRAGELQLRWRQDEQQMQQAADLFGCYVLRTDERTLSEHELWQLYISLTRAEDGFRALKTDLGLRPNPHHKEQRVDAHVFICVLAYHLLRNILWTLEQKGEHRTWETLKRVLRTHCYTTILVPTNRGQTHRIRRAGQPEECQKAIYRHLAIKWSGLPTARSVIEGHPVQTEDHAGPATL